MEAEHEGLLKKVFLFSVLDEEGGAELGGLVQNDFSFSSPAKKGGAEHGGIVKHSVKDCWIFGISMLRENPCSWFLLNEE